MVPEKRFEAMADDCVSKVGDEDTSKSNTCGTNISISTSNNNIYIHIYTLHVIT